MYWKNGDTAPDGFDFREEFAIQSIPYVQMGLRRLLKLTMILPCLVCIATSYLWMRSDPGDWIGYGYEVSSNCAGLGYVESWQGRLRFYWMQYTVAMSYPLNFSGDLVQTEFHDNLGWHAGQMFEPNRPYLYCETEPPFICNWSFRQPGTSVFFSTSRSWPLFGFKCFCLNSALVRHGDDDASMHAVGISAIAAKK